MITAKAAVPSVYLPFTPADFDNDIAPFTLQQEEGGTCTATPGDPGGITKWGVTLPTLAAWRGRPCAADDVRALDYAEAVAIAHAQYWNALQAFGLPRGVALMAFDHGYNAGVGCSARVLQRVLGVTVDGRIGPVTTGTARAVTDMRAFLADLTAAQESDYRGKADFPRFGAEWIGDPHGSDDWHRLGRLGRRHAAALKLAAL
jgi:lysozyme family protein